MLRKRVEEDRRSLLRLLVRYESGIVSLCRSAESSVVEGVSVDRRDSTVALLSRRRLWRMACEAD